MSILVLVIPAKAFHARVALAPLDAFNIRRANDGFAYGWPTASHDVQLAHVHVTLTTAVHATAAHHPLAIGIEACRGVGVAHHIVAYLAVLRATRAHVLAIFDAFGHVAGTRCITAICTDIFDVVVTGQAQAFGTV